MRADANGRRVWGWLVGRSTTGPQGPIRCRGGIDVGSEDLGDEDDQRAADREQQLIEASCQQRGGGQRGGGRLDDHRQEHTAKDDAGHQADRQVPEGAAPGAPADPLQRQAETAVFGGLDGQDPQGRRPGWDASGVHGLGDALLHGVGGRQGQRGGQQAGDALQRQATLGGHAAEGDADTDQQRPRHGLEGLRQDRSGADVLAEPGRHQQQGQLQQEPERDGQPGDAQQRRPWAAGWLWPRHGCLRSIN